MKRLHLAWAALTLASSCTGLFKQSSDDAVPKSCDVTAAPLTRLNTGELDSSFAAVLGDTTHPARLFASDVIAPTHFDNDATQLSIAPRLVQDLEAAAAGLVDDAWAKDAALLAGAANTTADGQYSATLKGTGGQASVGGARNDNWNLWSNGEVTYQFSLPAAASYQISISAYGEQVPPDPVKAELWLNDQKVASFDVTATVASPQALVSTQSLPAGNLKVGVRFLNDVYDPGTNLDRNLLIRAVSVTGQASAPGGAVTARPRLQVCVPASAAEEARCATQVLTAFARTAWRRPATADELATLTDVYRATRDDGDDYVTAVKLGLRTVLVSPNFLLRTEQVVPTGKASSSWAVASRLSYFLWGAPPDDELSMLADQAGLADAKVVSGQVKRLLADPRATSLKKRFTQQWFNVRNVAGVSLDAALFPGVTQTVMQDMQLQADAYLDEFLYSDRDAMDLIDAPVTFATPALGAFLGLPVSGTGLTRVSLAADDPRAGLMGQSGPLVVTSKSTETNPPRRGNYVLERLLCSPLPLPVGITIPPVPQATPDQPTTRARLETLTSPDQCQGCHRQLNAIGFALEPYAADSRVRTTENGGTIDPSGSFDGTSFKTAPQLFAFLKKDPRYEQCFARKALSFGLGRPLNGDDSAIVDTLTGSFHTGHRFQSLLEATATAVAVQGCKP
jgi:hypothetical protein